MPYYRHTAFMRDDDGHGWSETHDWDSGSDVDINLSARAAAFNQLMITHRVPLLAKDGFYLGCRVSRYKGSELGKIQSFPIFLDLPMHGTENVSTAKTEMDASLLAVKVTFANSNGTARADTYLRGVWEQVITAGQLDFSGVAGSTFAQLLKSYQNALMQFGYGWLGKAPNSRYGYVNSYKSNTDGTITFELNPQGGGGMPFGRKFTLYVARLNDSDSVLNRPILCTSNGPLEATSVNQIAAGPFRSKGTFYVREPGFFRYDQVAYRKLSSRKTGRPTGVGRGRSPTRRVY